MSKYTMELREAFEPIKYSPPIFTRDEVEGWFKDYDLYDYLTIEQVNIIEKADITSNLVETIDQLITDNRNNIQKLQDIISKFERA